MSEHSKRASATKSGPGRYHKGGKPGNRISKSRRRRTPDGAFDCPGPPRRQWPQRAEYPPQLDWSEVDGNPYSVSYWQRGCDDAKAGRPETWPTNRGGFDRSNIGYSNGYDYGRRKYRMQAVGQSILAREKSQ